MTRRLRFKAVKPGGRAITEDGSIAQFEFEDVEGNVLTLEMGDELAAFFVARLQSTFVAQQTHKVGGVGSEDIRHGRFLNLALRPLNSVEAQPALVRSPPVVHLQLDKGTKSELNYSLHETEADRLAQNLQSAAEIVRQEKKGQGQ